MTSKSLLVFAAVAALTASPALAGAGCGGQGHASNAQSVATAPQSTAGEAAVSSIPYPLPTLDEGTQTAAADVSSTKKSAE